MNEEEIQKCNEKVLDLIRKADELIERAESR
jgi:hypothetical protein